MHSNTEARQAGTQPPFTPTGPVADLLSALPELVERSGRLVTGAALKLGLDAQGAAQAGQTATLNSGDNTIVILPMEHGDDGTLSLMLSVQTRVPLNVGGGLGDALAVLQHAPGALHTFAASLGATPDGCWVLHRSVRVRSDDASALASHLVETLRLAEFVLPVELQSSH
jgi:hypothetical protein